MVLGARRNKGVEDSGESTIAGPVQSVQTNPRIMLGSVAPAVTRVYNGGFYF